LQLVECLNVADVTMITLNCATQSGAFIMYYAILTVWLIVVWSTRTILPDQWKLSHVLWSKVHIPPMHMIVWDIIMLNLKRGHC